MSASPGACSSVIVHVSSIIVPQSRATTFLEYVRAAIVPRYGGATGLVSVCFARREFVAYLEILTISTWESEGALTNFGRETVSPDMTQEYGLVVLEPHVYEILAFCPGSDFCDNR